MRAKTLSCVFYGHSGFFEVFVVFFKFFFGGGDFACYARVRKWFEEPPMLRGSSGQGFRVLAGTSRN